MLPLHHLKNKNPRIMHQEIRVLLSLVAFPCSHKVKHEKPNTELTLCCTVYNLLPVSPLSALSSRSREQGDEATARVKMNTQVSVLM